jgi:hypothetical protein
MSGDKYHIGSIGSVGSAAGAHRASLAATEVSMTATPSPMIRARPSWQQVIDSS